MKLYTEEQIREVLSNMLLTTEQVESILKELKPQGELKQSPEHIKPGIVYVNLGEGNAGPDLTSISESGSKGQQVTEKNGIKIIQN